MIFSLGQAKDLGDKLNDLKTSLTELRTKLANLSKEMQKLKDKLDGTDVLNAFLEKYKPPKELIDFIEAHKHDRQYCLYSTGPILYIPDDGSATITYFDKDFFCKDKGERNIARILHAEKLRQVVVDKKLNHIKIPKKYAYKTDFNVGDYSDYYSTGKIKDKFETHIVVYAEVIIPKDDDPLNPARRCFHGKMTKEELQQVVTLVEETGFYDLHKQNILRDNEDDKLVFIDTASDAFFKGPPGKIKRLKWFQHNFAGTDEYYDLATDDAKILLRDYIEALEKDTSKDNEIPYISYDPTGYGGSGRETGINPKALADPLFEKVVEVLKINLAN